MGVSAEQTVVPFLDLHATHEPLRESILARIAEIFETSAFTNGSAVVEFEAAFADFCGQPHCVGMASGLDALRLLLVAHGIEPGDEVVVPANTFVATAEAVTQAGGRPVLVDATEQDYNLDIAAVASAVTERTRFVLPVHLYGQLADMRALTPVAERAGLTVIEDACQAHGARRDGLAAGDAGDAAFSFYPGKNLGAIGDAGAATTSTQDVATRLRALREHGQRAKYEHELVGWTARLDTIQAAALLEKLPHLGDWNAQRAAAATFYSERLSGVGDLVLPPVAPGSEPVWHLYVVRTADPLALGEHLRGRGVQSGRHYPQPVHLTGAYKDLGYPEGSFPIAEALARECLSLPIFPGIQEAQLEQVASAVESYF